ncbi:LysR family transcriptional regulator [Naumannella halotolerans]|uniref:LysR family transcriptional regulator n=1 Tax=Naumannella halotolerans TaxID=993414 RepID=UPI00370DD79E
MDVQVLRWFQLVADGVTVTEVSESEQVSQPAVSRALSRMEREVGTPLLRRDGRVLRMTHAGSALKHHVDAMMHAWDDGLAAVDQLLDPETGTVVIAFQPSLGTWLIPDLVRSFRDLHPAVSLDLRSNHDETIPAVGIGSEIDLELSTLRPPTDAEDLRWRGLVPEPLTLLLHRDHRLADAGQVELRDVAEDPFVIPRPTSLLARQTRELCAAAGFEPQVGLVADDLPTLRGFVAAGLGVALAPTLWGGSVAAPVEGVQVLALAGSPQREIGLSWSPQRRMLPAAELFAQHTVARARAGLLPRPVAVTGAVGADG